MEFICLANSYKGRERCIAGIDTRTGQWVRPVTACGEGAVDFATRNIGGQEPRLLDTIQISVMGKGPDFGCQRENVLVGPKPWIRTGRASFEQAARYCENTLPLLHDNERRINRSFFRTIPPEQWKSLQLIYVQKAEFSNVRQLQRERSVGRFCLQGRFFEMWVTDPFLVERLKRESRIVSDCFLTISLTPPFQKDGYCYKLIAGVLLV